MDMILNGEMGRTANHKMTVMKFRRFLSLTSRSVVLQLHQHSWLRVTSHWLYLDYFELECQQWNKSTIHHWWTRTQ